MADIFVGKSEFGSLRGTNQYAEQRAGLQILALLAFLAPMLAGYRITFNEARRSRPDQDKFWAAYQKFLRYGKPRAAVAARPYTSKHDSGLAFDLGGPGGAVISDAAHALLVKYGPEWGIHWIGKNFGEKWHFEYVPGTARKLAGTGPTKQERIEEEMTARLYRNSQTGTIAAIDWSTGAVWPIPSPAYLNLMTARKMVIAEDAINLPPNEYDFIVGRAVNVRAENAQAVLDRIVSGADGSATLGNRIVEIQRLANAAANKKVDLTGATINATVNEDALVTKIETVVKRLFGKAAA